MDWKNNFDRETLFNGYLLFRQGRVSPIYRQGDYCFAIVDGREKVRARLVDDTISDLQCTCLPSREGRLCAHQAAFLFALENTLENQRQSAPAAAENRNHPEEEEEKDFEEMDREADDSNRADQDLETEEHTEADQEDTDPYFAEPDEPEDSVEQWRRRFAQNPGLRRYPYNLENTTENSNSNFTNPNEFEPEQAASPAQSEDEYEQPVLERPETPWKNPFLDSLLSPQGLFGQDESEATNPYGRNREDHPVESAIPPKTQMPRGAAVTSLAPDKEAISGADSDVSVKENFGAQTMEPKAPVQPEEEAEDSSNTTYSAANKSEGAKEPAPEKETEQPNVQEETARQTSQTSFEASIDYSSLSSLVDSFSLEDLAGLVKEYGTMHPEMQDFLTASIAKSHAEEAQDLLERRAMQKIAEILQDHPESRCGSREIRSFENWMEEQCDVLVRNGSAILAAELLESILLTLERTATVSNASFVLSCGEFVLDLLEKIALRAEPALIKELFSWIEYQLEANNLPDFKDHLVTLMERNCFDIADLQEVRYQSLVRLYGTSRKEGKLHAYRDRLLRSILDLEKENPEYGRATSAFEKTYGMLPEVLILKAVDALKENDPKEAVQLLNQSRRKGMSASQEEKVMRLMIQAQLKLSHPEKAVQELYELIFVLQNGRLEDLQLLHELDSNDQWKDDLEKIEKSVDEDVLIELYDFLKEDEKLLDLMEKSKNYYHLSRFADRLSGVDPDRTAALWLNYAKESAASAHSREAYRRSAIAFEKASQSEILKDQVKEAVHKTREDHRRQHAFIEELDRLGTVK